MKKNFKRLVITAIVLSLVVTLFSGCGNESTKKAGIGDPFVPIEGQEENGLVYHRESKTVYVLFSELGYQRESGYLTLYIVNGHYCEYKDGEIVEVIPECQKTDGDTTTKTADEKWNSLTEEEKEALLAGQ